MRIIEKSIEQMGVEFIIDYCIKKGDPANLTKQITKRRGSKKNNDLVQIQCYRKNDPLEAAKQLFENKRKEEGKEPVQGGSVMVSANQSTAHMENEEEEECNLSDNEEEKTTVQASTQKKAFLSLDKILNSIKQEVDITQNESSLMLTRNQAEEAMDQFGTLIKVKDPLPKMIAKKLDQVLLRKLALKSRGFLHRKSVKYSHKWQKGFYYIDIDSFTSV